MVGEKCNSAAMDSEWSDRNAPVARKRWHIWLTWMWVTFLMESSNTEVTSTIDQRPRGCSICLHAIAPSQRFKALCGHTFHRGCIASWMRTYAFCPDCPSRM